MGVLVRYIVPRYLGAGAKRPGCNYSPWINSLIITYSTTCIQYFQLNYWNMAWMYKVQKDKRMDGKWQDGGSAKQQFPPPTLCGGLKMNPYSIVITNWHVPSSLHHSTVSTEKTTLSCNPEIPVSHITHTKKFHSNHKTFQCFYTNLTNAMNF